MKVGVLGTGMVGRGIGERLAELGHEVMIGTRDVAALLAKTETDERGQVSFSQWQGAHAGIQVGTFAEAAAFGELLVNATAGGASLAALEAAGAEHLNGKVLIDIANALDFSQGMPPTLSVINTDSLGEQIQRAYPALRVVKTLNTVTVDVMVHPELIAGGDHHIFLSGDDAAAKAQVTELLRSFGWQHILDLGDIGSARSAEVLTLTWVQLWGVLGTPMFGFKIAQ